MKQISDKVSHAEFIMQEFEKMWSHWEEKRERIALDQIAQLHADEERERSKEAAKKSKKDKESTTKTKSK